MRAFWPVSPTKRPNQAHQLTSTLEASALQGNRNQRRYKGIAGHHHVPAWPDDWQKEPAPPFKKIKNRLAAIRA